MKLFLSKSFCLISLFSLTAFAQAETATTTQAAAPATPTVATTATTATTTTTTPTSSLSPAQQAEVRTIVEGYLSDPQHLVQMVGNINKAMAERQFDGIKQSISANAQPLFFSPTSIVAGNPKGTVTLVEYYDYLCPYCKTAEPGVDKAISENSNLRVVFKQFPLPNHGEAAVFAAKAALASVQQNKFLPFHQALMAYNGALTQPIILDIAKKSGLDMAKLAVAMDSPAVMNQLKEDMRLAEAIHLPGTPTMIVAKTTPGKTPQDASTIDKFIIIADPSPQGLQNAINELK